MVDGCFSLFLSTWFCANIPALLFIVKYGAINPKEFLTI